MLQEILPTRITTKAAGTKIGTVKVMSPGLIVSGCRGILIDAGAVTPAIAVEVISVYKDADGDMAFVLKNIEPRTTPPTYEAFDLSGYAGASTISFEAQTVVIPG